MEELPVSLVTATLGRTEPLRRLLQSLRHQDFRDFEVIVVDQNPPGTLDPLLAGFADLDLRVVRSEKGLSRARNVGIAAARGGILGFPDDDCWYPPGLLGQAVARLRTPLYPRDDRHPPTRAPDLVLGRTVDAHGADSIGSFLRDSQPVDRDNVWNAGNSNGLFVRRDLALLVGGFEETLGVGASSPYQSGEETDFVLRCIAAGRNAHYFADLAVFHEQREHPATPAETAAHLRRVSVYARGYGHVLRRNRYSPLFPLERAARSCMSGLRELARGDLAQGRHRLSWAGNVLHGYLTPVAPGRHRPPRPIRPAPGR